MLKNIKVSTANDALVPKRNNVEGCLIAFCAWRRLVPKFANNAIASNNTSHTFLGAWYSFIVSAEAITRDGAANCAGLCVGRYFE